jgi:hydrogenase maturation protein HypF
MSGSPVGARRLEISGVVQGVGFRPFLFGLAQAHGVFGRVSNTPKGVELVIEGPEDALDAFVSDIPEKTPPLSRITAIDAASCPVAHFSGFEIVKSREAADRFTLISPDVSVCPDCLAELTDPLDRRFEYPFINCTNCGPRYTIIKDIPYDRPKTCMGKFTMCPACQAEYDNPLDRRFHAQPNACPVCGPKIFLTDNQGNRVDTGPAHALDMAADLLGQGKIVAVKGLGGFHLAVDACNAAAVAELRRRKLRPDKPFALMAAPEADLFDHVTMGEAEKKLLFSFHRPIVLLNKVGGKENRAGRPGIAPCVAPGHTCLGIMLPYTPLHYLLLKKGPDILVMTSGNRSGHPLSIDNADALDAFSHIADYFLFHDRDIYFRADDSIARVQKGKSRFLRRSRGYAPLPVDLDPPHGKVLPPVIGLGAGLKSTICLTRDQYGFLSQHIGDLEYPQTHEFYGQTIDHMKKILNITPAMAVHDLHPGYYSTGVAARLRENGHAVMGVQHHHAHALACMAENRLDGEVLAITLDGTGFGTDGHIWGGEVLACTFGGFSRLSRLKYLPMPGGDAAATEPWRMAASMLYAAFGKDLLSLDIPWIRAMDVKKLGFLVQMMDRRVNTPLTSSCGRLFDGVSSLLELCHKMSHESQAAMVLEAVAGTAEDPYAFGMAFQEGDDGKIQVLDLMPAIKDVVRGLSCGTDKSTIAARFHATVAHAFARAAVEARAATGLNRVVLSGGVFNNDLIFTRMVEILESESFSVYTHSCVPCGDGGIALGQVMAGAWAMGENAGQ